MHRVLNREDLLKWTPLIVLVALVLMFTIIEPRFFSILNLARIGMSSAPALMVAVGVTFIIIMGSIDLSMEGSVAVCAVVFAQVFLMLGGSLAGWGLLAVPLALLVGAVIGVINGLVHVKLRIPSFMSSLAVGFVGIGFSMMITGGMRIRIDDPLFRALITERFLGFPLMVYVAGFALLVGWFIQSRTIIGRNIYALGGGEDLAKASGVNVTRVRVAAFGIAGVFYAMGALLAVGRVGIAETATGNNLMFASITSVVVGGTVLWGGKGGVWNTLLGVLIVNIIYNGMVVIGLPGYIQSGVLGLLIIAVVALSTNRKTLSIVK